MIRLFDNERTIFDRHVDWLPTHHDVVRCFGQYLQFTEPGESTAVKREEFTKNKKDTSKKGLSLLLCKVWYFTSNLLIG